MADASGRPNSEAGRRGNTPPVRKTSWALFNMKDKCPNSASRPPHHYWVVLTPDRIHEILTRAASARDTPADEWVKLTTDALTSANLTRTPESMFLLLTEHPEADGQHHAVSLTRSLDWAIHATLVATISPDLRSDAPPEEVARMFQELQSLLTWRLRVQARQAAREYAEEFRRTSLG